MKTTRTPSINQSYKLSNIFPFFHTSVNQNHSPPVLLWVLTLHYISYQQLIQETTYQHTAIPHYILTIFCNKANQHLFEEKESEKEITKHSYQSYHKITRKYSACLAWCSYDYLRDKLLSDFLQCSSQLSTYRHKIE